MKLSLTCAPAHIPKLIKMTKRAALFGKSMVKIVSPLDDQGFICCIELQVAHVIAFLAGVKLTIRCGSHKRGISAGAHQEHQYSENIMIFLLEIIVADKERDHGGCIEFHDHIFIIQPDAPGPAN